jgi:hypothetical protein
MSAKVPTADIGPGWYSAHALNRYSLLAFARGRKRLLLGISQRKFPLLRVEQENLLR